MTTNKFVVAGCLWALFSAQAAGSGKAFYAEDTGEIIWFVHISDTHLGKGWDSTRQRDALRWALFQSRYIINPAFTVNTGDLAEGIADCWRITDWNWCEWCDYRDLYQAAGMTPQTYFDPIGNHDLFYNEGISHYRQYSMQGPLFPDARIPWTRGNHFFYGMNTEGTASQLLDAPGCTWDRCQGTSCLTAWPEGTVPGEVNALRTQFANNSTNELKIVFGHRNVLAMGAHRQLALDALARIDHREVEHRARTDR